GRLLFPDAFEPFNRAVVNRGGEQVVGDQSSLEQVFELGVGTGEFVERVDEDGIGLLAAKEEELAAELERRLGSADRSLEQGVRIAQMLDRCLAVDRRFCRAELAQQLRSLSRRGRLSERPAQV